MYWCGLHGTSDQGKQLLQEKWLVSLKYASLFSLSLSVWRWPVLAVILYGNQSLISSRYGVIVLLVWLYHYPWWDGSSNDVTMQSSYFVSIGRTLSIWVLGSGIYITLFVPLQYYECYINILKKIQWCHAIHCSHERYKFEILSPV